MQQELFLYGPTSDEMRLLARSIVGLRTRQVLCNAGPSMKRPAHGRKRCITQLAVTKRSASNCLCPGSSASRSIRVEKPVKFKTAWASRTAGSIETAVDRLKTCSSICILQELASQ